MKSIVFMAVLGVVAVSGLAYATVEEQTQIPPLVCGINSYQTSATFRRFQLLTSQGTKEADDKQADEYCDGLAERINFIQNLRNMEEACENRKCPANCNRYRTSRVNPQSVIFGSVQRQDTNESDEEFENRRNKTIDILIKDGQCGYSEEAHAGCRQLIDNGSLIIAYCRGDWSLSIQTLCD